MMSAKEEPIANEFMRSRLARMPLTTGKGAGGFAGRPLIRGINRLVELSGLRVANLTYDQIVRNAERATGLSDW